MEIEKKYLTSQIPFSLENYKSLTIAQSYISTCPTIRIRQSNHQYSLTVKGAGSLSREEFELEITKEQYENLQKKAETREILKKRYLVPLNHCRIAEVDVYEGFLSGLVTTEVEFDTMDEADAFTAPEWFGKDISFDNRYKNTNLALYGIPQE